jgi:predicted nucleic acid-binding protein
MGERAFLDTNVIVYQYTEDARGITSEALFDQFDICISVQVLNEFTNIARKKLKFSWPTVDDAIDAIGEASSTIVPLTIADHHKARELATKYQFSVYDACIIACALATDCNTIFSEDMQDGMVIENRLTISNPFGCNPFV